MRSALQQTSDIVIWVITDWGGRHNRNSTN
jgi:hypothetical protein